MTPTELGLSIALLAITALVRFAVNAAYRNGVTDGYGYAVEPTCPGYAQAGRYLRHTMSHRWPELKEPS